MTFVGKLPVNTAGVIHFQGFFFFFQDIQSVCSSVAGTWLELSVTGINSSSREVFCGFLLSSSHLFSFIMNNKGAAILILTSEVMVLLSLLKDLD